MKPVAFDYTAPADLDAAARLLGTGEARAVAGGQSLGAMLNLRLARPAALVDLSRLAALRGAAQSADEIVIGAAVTHAEIADGRTPDLAGNILARIAGGIAYRAVRNRGTLGGSLAHADPAADWPNTLLALDAAVITHGGGSGGGSGGRRIAMADFILGAFRTALRPGEILRAVAIPKSGPGARWGYFKLCRKPGEFAHALAAALIDPARGTRRLVIGATGDRPLLLTGAEATLDGAARRLDAAQPELDAIDRGLYLGAVARALGAAA